MCLPKDLVEPQVLDMLHDPSIALAWVGGSHAYGTALGDSDVDVRALRMPAEADRIIAREVADWLAATSPDCVSLGSALCTRFPLGAPARGAFKVVEKALRPRSGEFVAENRFRVLASSRNVPPSAASPPKPHRSRHVPRR